METTLFETQKQLQKAFCIPDQQSVDWGIVRELVLDQPPVAVETRVDIYRSGYFFRLRDALKDDFPRLYAALGDENFRVLLREYVACFPSRHQNLGELGRHLVEFLASTSIGARYALLGEIAKVEWLAVESYWADEAAVRDTSDAEFHLRLHPAVRLLESEFALLEIWNGSVELSPEVVEESREWPTERRCFCVTRESGRVVLKALLPFEFAFLQAVADGLGMEEAGEKSFAQWSQAEDEFAAAIQKSISDWVAEKVLLV